MPVQTQGRHGGIDPTHLYPRTRRRGGQHDAPAALPPAGGWLGLGAGLDGTEDLITLGFDPRTAAYKICSVLLMKY